MSFLSMHILTYVLLGLDASILFCALLRDIAVRSIPNWMSIAIGVFGLGARLVTGDFLHSLLAAVAVFMAAAFCWRRGWMGGGDVKLLGAAATTVPQVDVLNLVILVALAGGVLALVYLAARWIVPTPHSPAQRLRPVALPKRVWRVECRRIRRGGPLPYACAIAAGAILAQYATGV